MTSPGKKAGLTHGEAAPSRRIRELGLWPMVAAFSCGLVLHMLGVAGQVVALLGLLCLVLYLFNLVLQGKRSTFQYAVIVGCLVNGEVFIRDFALRALPMGYLGVQYLVILLGLASLPSLVAREWRLVASAPILIFLCICLWDSLGLLYSQDLWLGRIITGLHWAGLACLLLGAAAFAGEDARRGLLDGLILGAFLSLGVMLRQTVKSSYGMELDSGFRFGHALVSAVQVGIVLTTGMLACLLKLISGYGKPRHALVSLALLAPFCVATFSRGPMLAFFSGALCLSLYRRRSQGWWKLPAAGFLLAGAVFAVMWALPSNFNSRYQELQGKDDRSRVWGVVGEMWKQSPIIGYGPGSWAIVYPRFAAKADRAPGRLSDAHNFMMQAAADGGVIGVGLFVLFCLALLVRIVRARSAMALAFFVFVIVNASLANFKLSVLFLLLGAGLGDCLSPVRSWKQTVFPARIRGAWPAVAAGRRLVPRRFAYPGKHRSPASFRA